jgi:hypothetical protein|mmetsp:Transcript_31241/g.50597  ORF Transcript_31241/g.50597 Transcript_31241/m.50597 type:complete len:158 (-) Transcript_31241:1732-2205(-)
MSSCITACCVQGSQGTEETNGYKIRATFRSSNAGKHHTPNNTNRASLPNEYNYCSSTLPHSSFNHTKYPLPCSARPQSTEHRPILASTKQAATALGTFGVGTGVIRQKYFGHTQRANIQTCTWNVIAQSAKEVQPATRYGPVANACLLSADFPCGGL